MKNVLFLHQSSSIGGGSYCLLNILESIDRSQIRPIVALSSNGPLYQEICKLGICVATFRQMSAIPYNCNLFRPRSIISYVKVINSTLKFKHFLRRYKPDIVYLNNMMLCHYLRPSKSNKCKTVIHIREHWPSNEHQIQFSWIRKTISLYADEVIAINKYSASMFSNIGKKIHIVYDWIDMERRYKKFDMSKIFGNDIPNIKIYLYVGGVQKIKGGLDVVNGFSMCVKSENARLLILGMNINKEIFGFKDFIKRTLSYIGIRSYYYLMRDAILKDCRIRCIPATYMISDIVQQSYCNLSYFTIPHANLAMAEFEILGLPSIAAETEESREYSFNGKLSSLFPINSKEEFYKAIIEYDKNVVTIKQQLKIHNSQLKSMFSKTKNSEKLNNILNNISIK